MAIKFGLTEKGFIAPTYAEWLEDVEGSFKSRFGDDIALSSNSNFGMLAREYAWRMVEVTEQLQLVYYAGFYSTATDTSLDRLGANIGVVRKVAAPSHVALKITTDDEYLIQAGEQFETEDGIVFNLLDDVVTKKDNDGNWVGIGNLESDETGSMNNVGANTITVVSNPDDAILEVINQEPAYGGNDEETDEDYRERLVLENISKEGPTANGIRSALMNVSGVREVGIVDNDQNSTDEYGNPPYSVHVYVLGGADNDIAETLNDRVAAGVTLAGSKAVNITDDSGITKTIRFDHATEVPIFIQVEIKTSDSWNQDDGPNQIKTDISQKINALDMGQTVHLTKLFSNVYDKPGVEEASIKIGLAKDSLSYSDVKVKRFEVPVCTASNVEVVVDG
ncbi:MAG: hypothetical protein [Bacteriophage sp.]|nr:MAG: hypothetical protein [Bacteriophage sp.]